MGRDELHAVWCNGCGHQYEDPAQIAALRSGRCDGCPRCGSRSVTFGVGLFAEQSMSASMVAHKLPKSVRVDRGGSNPQVGGADLGAAGDLSDEVEGPASPKGSSELRTATILVEHLNSHGA